MAALALQASLLLRYIPAAVSDAFCATRLDGDWGYAFDALPHGLDMQAIVARAGGLTVASPPSRTHAAIDSG